MIRSPGLYVHVPFCSAICPYCDFAVVTDDGDRRKRYVERLLRELEARTELSGFDTLYFGGGTPSLLASDDLFQICERASLTEDARVFLEANPEDVNETSLARWRELGVSTLSLGLQSFDDDVLSFLGRRHTGADSHTAMEAAHEVGFETLSIDLIFGLPDQSLRAWQETLRSALAHEPDHISCYQLTIHDETLFGRHKREGKLEEAGDDLQAELFLETHRALAEAGYAGYEVSSFARGGKHRSQQNEKYWNHTPYLGIGPSAHSFDGRTRSWNTRSLFSWQRQIDSGARAIAGEETLDDDALLLETIMLRLRTADGLDFDDVSERFHVDLLQCNRELVDRLCDEKLVELSGRCLRPTVQGLAVADSLATSFETPAHPWH